MILYLHGLNSGAASAKARALQAALPGLKILVPTYPAHRPRQAVARLEGLVARLPGESLLIVGSSMGGFYGRHLCRRFTVGHLVMINPALAPWDLLPPYAGPQHNPVTGEDYLLSAADIEETRAFGVSPNDAAETPTTLFLDRGDEIIDPRIALDRYRDQGEIHLYAGGSHGFDHMPQAIARIREIHAGLPGFRRADVSR